MKYLNDVTHNDCVGKVFKSKSSGYFKVVKFSDSGNVEIQFLNTGYEAVVNTNPSASHTHKNRGGNYWFKEGDWTNAISPFTLIEII